MTGKITISRHIIFNENVKQNENKLPKKSIMNYLITINSIGMVYLKIHLYLHLINYCNSISCSPTANLNLSYKNCSLFSALYSFGNPKTYKL